MKCIMILAICLFLAGGIVHTWAQGATHSIQIPETKLELKPGDGLTKVEAFCNICHSLDYIIMQPKLTRLQWTATVTKMIKVFGAPINEEDSRIITDYLTVHYGTGK